MRALIMCGLAAGFTTLAANGTASAFLPSQPALERTSYQSGDVIQIARKARPRGWNQGRKVGWRGGKVPPGQRGKR